MGILLGLDLGTSGVKVLAVRETGEIIASAREEYELYQPRSGWSEQDPDDWWKSTIQALRSILEKDRVETNDIRGMALSGQMHGSVFLDEEGGVIRRPLLWNDTRTAPQCDEIHQIIGEKTLIQRVGNPALEGFTAPKILWLRSEEPEHFERLSTLLLPKDYIVYRLTGQRSTEVSDAAGTLLFDVESRNWSEPILESLNLSPSILPPVRQSVDVVDTLRSDLARELGVSESVPVVAGGADNACSAVGTGIIRQGLASASIGSSGVVLAHTDRMHRDPGGRIHSFNHAVPDSWYVMGVMLSAAISRNWYRDQIDARGVSHRELDEEAREVPPGSEGVWYLPYLNGERTPHRDPHARGVFFGLSQLHSRKHLNRAVLEGVAYGLKDSLELIRELGMDPEQIRVTGGGAKSPLWRQILANVFGRPVVTLKVEEGPAFGAALIAGVGAGTYSDLSEAVETAVEPDRTVQPDPEHGEVYNERYEIYRSLYESLREDFSYAHQIVSS